MPAPEEIAQPVVVTGATGFVGGALVRRLVSQAVPVRALVRSQQAAADRQYEHVELAVGDVTDSASIDAALRGAGTVMHCAAKVSDWGDATEFERVNVDGTRHVLRAAARQGTRVVLVSSVIVYGSLLGKQVCDEDARLGQPLGHYGRTKQAQELVARELADELSVPLTIVRPTNIYGPGCRPWVDQVSEALQAGLPVLMGGGRQNAGLVYIDNLVDLLIEAARHPIAISRTYNGCDELEVTWKQYFSDLARMLDAHPPRSLPLPLGRLAAVGGEGLWRLLHIPTRPPLTREALSVLQADHQVPAARARVELGYRPRIGYEQAMQAVERYVERGRRKERMKEKV